MNSRLTGRQRSPLPPSNHQMTSQCKGALKLFWWLMVVQHMLVLPLICHPIDTHFPIISAHPHRKAFPNTSKEEHTPVNYKFILVLSLSVRFSSSSHLSLICCSHCWEATACVCLDHNVATLPSMHSGWVEDVRQCNPSRSQSRTPSILVLLLHFHSASILSVTFLFSFTQSTTKVPSFILLPWVFSLHFLTVCLLMAVFIWGGLLASHVGLFFKPLVCISWSIVYTV